MNQNVGLGQNEEINQLCRDLNEFVEQRQTAEIANLLEKLFSQRIEFYVVLFDSQIANNVSDSGPDPKNKRQSAVLGSNLIRHGIEQSLSTISGSQAKIGSIIAQPMIMPKFQQISTSINEMKNHINCMLSSRQIKLDNRIIDKIAKQSTGYSEAENEVIKKISIKKLVDSKKGDIQVDSESEFQFIFGCKDLRDADSSIQKFLNDMRCQNLVNYLLLLSENKIPLRVAQNIASEARSKQQAEEMLKQKMEMKKQIEQSYYYLDPSKQEDYLLQLKSVEDLIKIDQSIVL